MKAALFGNTCFFGTRVTTTNHFAWAWRKIRFIWIFDPEPQRRTHDFYSNSGTLILFHCEESHNVTPSLPASTFDIIEPSFVRAGWIHAFRNLLPATSMTGSPDLCGKGINRVQIRRYECARTGRATQVIRGVYHHQRQTIRAFWEAFDDITPIGTEASWLQRECWLSKRGPEDSWDYSASRDGVPLDKFKFPSQCMSYISYAALVSMLTAAVYICR